MRLSVCNWFGNLVLVLISQVVMKTSINISWVSGIHIQLFHLFAQYTNAHVSFSLKSYLRVVGVFLMAHIFDLLSCRWSLRTGLQIQLTPTCLISKQSFHRTECSAAVVSLFSFFFRGQRLRHSLFLQHFALLTMQNLFFAIFKIQNPNLGHFVVGQLKFQKYGGKKSESNF